MAYIVMAIIVMSVRFLSASGRTCACTRDQRMMAYIVMAIIVMADIVMAYTGMADMVMVYIVMAPEPNGWPI